MQLGTCDAKPVWAPSKGPASSCLERFPAAGFFQVLLYGITKELADRRMRQAGLFSLAAALALTRSFLCC